MNVKNEKFLNDIRKRKFRQVQELSKEEKVEREWQLLLYFGLTEEEIYNSACRYLQENGSSS